MIPETLQDLASLYALDLLEGDELAVFEAQLNGNAELEALVREMREAAGDLAHVAAATSPPPQLRDRVLREVALEAQRRAPITERRSSANWVPWAIAAALALFCGYLVLDRPQKREAVTQKEPAAATYRLAPAAPTAPQTAEATVTWSADEQSGVIKVANLPDPGAGKDYQLWAVDANHPDPIDAGLLKVNANGSAEIHFKTPNRAVQVKAFAISLERAGGVPKAEGPILLAGTRS